MIQQALEFDSLGFYWVLCPEFFIGSKPYQKVSLFFWIHIFRQIFSSLIPCSEGLYIPNILDLQKNKMNKQNS